MFTRQRLHQDISDLLLSADVLNVHPPISNALSNKVEPNINMLAPIMEDRVLTKGYSRLAIHLELKWRAPLALQLGEQPCKPDALTGRCRSHDILCLAGRQRDDLLLLGLLGYRARSEVEHHTGGAFPCINVTTHVGVAVPEHPQLLATTLVVAAELNCAHDIARDELNHVEVFGGGGIHKAAHIAHCECDVWPGVHQIPQAADEAPVLSGIHKWR
jgi:hypothetical protein